MDGFRWAKKDIGTAPFPKAKEYQKLKVEAYGQNEESESEIDLYTTDEGESEDKSEDESEDESKDESEDECKDESEDESKDESGEEPQKELQEKFSEQDSDQEESISLQKNWWDDYRTDSE
jgi:hypothetical protein